MDADQWERMMEIEVGNGENKLFGGAQYHRALREFNFAIRHMNAPEVRVTYGWQCTASPPHHHIMFDLFVIQTFFCLFVVGAGCTCVQLGLRLLSIYMWCSALCAWVLVRGSLCFAIRGVRSF